MSREIDTPKTIEDLRYLSERGLLPSDIKDKISDEDLQKLHRGEKVKIKGFGKQGGSDAADDAGAEDDYDNLTVDQLDAELASRVDDEGEPLSLKGNKADKVARLRENDASDD